MLVSWGLIFGGAYIRGGLYSGFYGICGTSLPEYMGTGDRNEKFLANCFAYRILFLTM